jgi:hypothetical protein
VLPTAVAALPQLCSGGGEAPWRAAALPALRGEPLSGRERLPPSLPLLDVRLRLGARMLSEPSDEGSRLGWRGRRLCLWPSTAALEVTAEEAARAAW